MDVVRLQGKTIVPVDRIQPRMADSRTPDRHSGGSWQEDLCLSQQALKESRRRQEERTQKMRDRLDSGADIREQIRRSNEQADAQGEAYEDMGRCIQIAISIMKGDNVPLQDKKFLMEQAPEIYRMAALMRREKEDPEDCESVLEDEADEAQSDTPEASGDGAEADAPAASGDGAEADAPAASGDGAESGASGEGAAAEAEA